MQLEGQNHPKGFAEEWHQPSPLQGPPCWGEGWDPPVPGSICSASLPAESFTLCSFEQNLCSWEVEVGQPAWERNTSLNLGTAYGIPTRDHSNNSKAGTWLGTGTPEESHSRSLGYHWPWGRHTIRPWGNTHLGLA